MSPRQRSPCVGNRRFRTARIDISSCACGTPAAAMPPAQIPPNRSRGWLLYGRADDLIRNTHVMKRILTIIILLTAITAFAAETASLAKNRMVIVISLDGFPGFALEDPKQPVPTLRKLIGKGTWTRMHTINP